LQLPIHPTVERFGGIDALVNNGRRWRQRDAASRNRSSNGKSAPDQPTGAFLTTKLVLRHLIERRGAVVNVASSMNLAGRAGRRTACRKRG